MSAGNLSDTIHKILNIISYCNQYNKQVVILSANIEKAFDSTEPKYLWALLLKRYMQILKPKLIPMTYIQMILV